jgi:hypothetical protein
MLARIHIDVPTPPWLAATTHLCNTVVNAISVQGSYEQGDLRTKPKHAT